MKLVMTLLARDEEDVVEENIAHHLNAGVDLIVATDNASRDGTTEILERHRRAGHLHLIREEDTSHRQSLWVTRMMRLASTELGADWIIHNDADQFWWPEDGASLREVFAAIPAEYGVLTAPKHNFVARAAEDGGWVERMVVRDVAPPRRPGEKRARGTSIAIAHRPAPAAKVGQGNHSLGHSSLRTLPPWFPIVIFHFPARSYDQFERKIRHGGEGYARNPYAPARSGTHKRRLLEVLNEGGLEEHWRRRVVVGDEAVAAGLAAGTLVEDTRLRDRLAALREGAQPGMRFRLPAPGGAREELAPRVDLVRALDREAAGARELALERRLSEAQKEVGRLAKELAKARKAAAYHASPPGRARWLPPALRPAADAARRRLRRRGSGRPEP